MSRTSSGLALALALACAAPEASAQQVDAETRTAARELATQGAEAFEKRDYQTALDRFQRASSLFRAPSISIMEARALSKLGRLVAALDKYQETRHTPLPPDAPEALTRAVTDAARESDELRPRIPLLRISILGKSPREGQLKVELDGKPVPSALLDVERPLDPGRHEIEASSPGSAVIHRQIDLSEGERRLVELELRASAQNQEPGSADRSPSLSASGSHTDSNSSSRVTWGWAAAGLGVVGLTTSAVTGVIALGKKSDLDSSCHPGCPAGSQDAIDSFRLNRTLSYATFAVGAAALGVGGYLLLSGSRESSHVSAGLSTQGASLSGAF